MMKEAMDTTMKDFEIEWSRRCKDIETVELSRNDAKVKKHEFDIAVTTLRFFLPVYDDEEFDKKTENIRWNFDIGLIKAQMNYRDHEAKRLKEAWGPMGALIYFLKKDRSLNPKYQMRT